MPSPFFSAPVQLTGASGSGPLPSGGSGLPKRRAPRKDPRPDRTRKAVLEAAAELFDRSTADAVTVGEIADHAHVSVGSIYLHFRDKVGLRLVLVEQAFEAAEEQFAAARSSASPLARITATADAYVRFALSNNLAFRVLAGDDPALSGEPRSDADAVNARVRTLLDLLAADLEQAIAAHEIEPVAVQDVVTFLWGSWNGVVSLATRDDAFTVSADDATRCLALGQTALVAALHSGL